MTTNHLPQTFGSYLLVDRIGSGGMAEVFQAVVFGTEGFKRVLVVKRIRAELSQSPEFVRMFTDEARITALLDHPNIVQVFDFGQVDGTYFLAMEHLDGKDLASVMRVLRPAGLSLRGSLVAQICLQIARGLHYAHTLSDPHGRPCRIVHRDINPANVMLLRTGGVKILDFGIAKASAIVGKAQTQHAKLKGKLGYLSPEQARGEPLDGRADVFSLGITMWEMLSGHRLFAARTDFERIKNVLHSPIHPPSVHRPAIPAALDRIVLRALARDTSDRYGSAEEMGDDLEAFLRTRRIKTDAIRQLLAELFGAEPSVSADRPLPEGSAPIAVSAAAVSGRVHRAITATHSIASGPLLTGFGGSAPGGGAPSRQAPAPRPRGFVWVVGAALLVAGLGAMSGLLRLGGGTRAASFSSGPLSSVSVEAGVASAPLAAREASATVRVEIQSEPPGATVDDVGGVEGVTPGRRRLGVTPLTVIFPKSSQVQHLRFQAAGFASRTYDVLPGNDGLILVELQRPAAGTADRSTKAPSTPARSRPTRKALRGR